MFAVVSRKTAFDIDFWYSITLKIYHHNASFDSLSAEFNDYFCNGKDDMNVNFSDFFMINILDYDPVDTERLKVDSQRLADGWYTYSFLELSQRYIIKT